MSAATLVERPGPIPGVIELVIDCDHGTTYGYLVNATERVRALSVDLLAERHEWEERCGCAVSLRVQEART